MPAALPLAATRILDLTRLLPGGVCTMLLAQLGANVIKVEDPQGGDYTRRMPPLIDGHGALFYALNRGKRSVVINLKDERGQAALRKLVEGADVLIESNRPGVMARLHSDYEALRPVNPRLIYCSLSGWGQDGPYAGRSGHDLNYVAVAGLLTRDAERPPGGQVADIGGAYAALSAILAALFRRERTGEGAYLDVSLFEAALPFVFQPWVEAATARLANIRPSFLTGGYACYNVYRAGDGVPVTLAALEPKFWVNFANAVGRPDLLEGNYLDGERQDALRATLADLFTTRAAAEWHELLHDADCCFAVASPVAALADDPQVQARRRADLDAKGVPYLCGLPGFGDDHTSGDAPPHFGEHTRDVLREAGYSDEELTALLADGVVLSSAPE